MIFHLQFYVYSMKYYMAVFLVMLTELTHRTDSGHTGWLCYSDKNNASHPSEARRKSLSLTGCRVAVCVCVCVCGKGFCLHEWIAGKQKSHWACIQTPMSLLSEELNYRQVHHALLELQSVGSVPITTWQEDRWPKRCPANKLLLFKSHVCL